MTIDGNIVVDGVLASCYSFSHHHLAHIVITPLRWFPDIMNSVFGVDNESPGYIKFAEGLGTWVL